MNICEHFLSSFNHVIRVQVYVEEVPWKRFEKVASLICVLSLIKDIGFMTYAEILLETIFFFLIFRMELSTSMHLFILPLERTSVRLNS